MVGVGVGHPSLGCLCLCSGWNRCSRTMGHLGDWSSRGTVACATLPPSPRSLLRKPLTALGPRLLGDNWAASWVLSITTHHWPRSRPGRLAPLWALCLGPWVDCFRPGLAHSAWWQQPFPLWLSCPLLEMEEDRPAVSHQVPTTWRGEEAQHLLLFGVLPGVHLSSGLLVCSFNQLCTGRLLHRLLAGHRTQQPQTSWGDRPHTRNEDADKMPVLGGEGHGSLHMECKDSGPPQYQGLSEGVRGAEGRARERRAGGEADPLCKGLEAGTAPRLSRAAAHTGNWRKAGGAGRRALRGLSHTLLQLILTSTHNAGKAR